MRTDSLVVPNMRKRFLLFITMLSLVSASLAQEFANIEYLCADWGPAMTRSGKTNEPPQFSDTEEEIYFLKQVGRFLRKKQPVPDPFSGSSTRDIGKGISIYLCKMKADGSGKVEIKELWRNPSHPIDTQAQSTWMDVNEKTRKIAMSITYGGGDITGLWTMNLDGSELKQVVRPEWSREKLVGIDHPSWTPNGEKIVFAEIMRGMHPQVSHIAICNPNGTSLKYLQTGTSEDYYGQPSVSPDGKSIVYVLISRTMGGVWLMSLEGSNVRPLANPADKRKGRHSGRYPTWSSDGKKILLTGTGLIDAESGERISYQLPICDGKKYSWGWAHWSKSGIVGYNVSGLSYTDNDIKMLKRLGVSRSMECEGGVPCNW